eukprot:s445_g4.t1
MQFFLWVVVIFFLYYGESIDLEAEVQKAPYDCKISVGEGSGAAAVADQLFAAAPWFCKNCRCMRKASANNCDKCGQSWRKAHDPSFIYNPGNRAPSAHRAVEWQEDADYYQWVQTPQTGKSPRNGQPRQRSKRHRGRGQAGPKGQGRGDGYNHAEYGFGVPPPEPDPPWLRQPMQPVPPPPAPAPETPRLDPAVQAFLADCSKNPDELPPHLQTSYHKIKAVAAKQEGQVLLSAVQTLTDAKKELADAQKQRSLLHSNWTKFLQTQVGKWKEYAEQFQNAEATAVSRIQNAQELYSSACSTLNQKKVETGVAPPATEVLDVDDPSLKAVSTTNSTKISESMLHLQETLTSLHQSAEELAADSQQALKRPRTEVNEAGMPDVSTGGLPSQPGGRAMQPFSMPGQ